MKFYNDFNSMFNAQSGAKKNMSVFNSVKYCQWHGSRIGGYEVLFNNKVVAVVFVGGKGDDREGEYTLVRVYDPYVKLRALDALSEYGYGQGVAKYRFGPAHYVDVDDPHGRPRGLYLGADSCADEWYCTYEALNDWAAKHVADHIDALLTNSEIIDFNY